MSVLPPGFDSFPIRSLDRIRSFKSEATARLLGATIELPDEVWQAPSALPGWTRAHIAAHLARNADGLAQVVDGLVTGRPVHLYSSDLARITDIERGSERTALDLQVDLDTTAGKLEQAFDFLSGMDPNRMVELSRGLILPIWALPLARLHEVVSHQIDLQIGFSADDIDPAAAPLLLAWACWQIGDRPDYPALEIRAQSGYRICIGNVAEKVSPKIVVGPDAQLYAWLIGRQSSTDFDTQSGVKIPGPLT